MFTNDETVKENEDIDRIGSSAIKAVEKIIEDINQKIPIIEESLKDSDNV